MKKSSSDRLDTNMNVLSLPPLSLGERFEDVYEVILILDDREQFAIQWLATWNWSLFLLCPDIILLLDIGFNVVFKSYNYCLPVSFFFFWSWVGSNVMLFTVVWLNIYSRCISLLYLSCLFVVYSSRGRKLIEFICKEHKIKIQVGLFDLFMKLQQIARCYSHQLF